MIRAGAAMSGCVPKTNVRIRVTFFDESPKPLESTGVDNPLSNFRQQRRCREKVTMSVFLFHEVATFREEVRLGVAGSFLAAAWAQVRTLRLVDGPDEVNRTLSQNSSSRNGRERVPFCRVSSLKGSLDDTCHGWAHGRARKQMRQNSRPFLILHQALLFCAS